MNIELDARNLICPMPVIKTQNKVASLNYGDTLTVFCTDPGALHDIPAWCRVHNHQLVSAETIDNEHIISIRVNK